MLLSSSAALNLSDPIFAASVTTLGSTYDQLPCCLTAPLFLGWVRVVDHGVVVSIDTEDATGCACRIGRGRKSDGVPLLMIVAVATVGLRNSSRRSCRRTRRDVCKMATDDDPTGLCTSDR